MQSLFLFLISLASAALQAQTLVIATGEWAPLISSKAANDGPIAMVVKEAFATSGVPSEINFHPWKRAMEEVRLSRVDAGFAWRKTEVREREFLFSDEIYEGVNVLFHLKSNSFSWRRVADLRGYRVGGALGYAYSKAFDEAVATGALDVFRVNDERSLVGLLITDRIDVFPADREVVQHIIRSEYPARRDEIIYHPLPLTRKPLHLIALPTDRGRELIRQFNSGLQYLKSSGRFHQIYQMLSR